MATNVYTASYLIAQLKRYGFIPGSTGSGSSLTDEDLCALANDEAQLYLTALIKSVREDHLEVLLDIAVTSGTAEYRIPSRAAGNSLSLVFQLSNDVPVPLPQAMGRWAAVDSGASGTPVCFELLGPRIVLHPTPSGSGTLRVRYVQRLSRLVLEEAVGLISAINTGTNTVTLSGTVPSTFVTGEEFDLVRGDPPFDNLDLDLAGTASGQDITFAALPSGLAVGDYVALAGETPIPQVPPELHALLSKRVALVVAQAVSAPNRKDLEEAVKTLREAALGLLTPRVSQGAQPIINRNGPGWGRWRGNGRNLL